MPFTMTPAMWMLVDLLISNAIKAAFQEVQSMTPEQVDQRTKQEEERKKKLTDELYS